MTGREGREEGGRGGQRWKKVVLIFTTVLIFLFNAFIKVFLPFVVQFFAFFHDIEHFLHIFCLPIFQARSCASAFL